MHLEKEKVVLFNLKVKLAYCIGLFNRNVIFKVFNYVNFYYHGLEIIYIRHIKQVFKKINVMLWLTNRVEDC